MSFRGGALVIGVGRIRRRHFDVGNSHSGVGRLFLMWEIPFGVGTLFLVREIAIGVGNCDRSGAYFSGVGNLRGLPARSCAEIGPGTARDLAHAPPAGPKLRIFWSGASFSADDSTGAGRASSKWSPRTILQSKQGATATHFRV